MQLPISLLKQAFIQLKKQRKTEYDSKDSWISVCESPLSPSKKNFFK